MKQQYYIKTKYLFPRTGHVSTELNGPLSSKKKAEDWARILIQKRNVISVEIRKNDETPKDNAE